MKKILVTSIIAAAGLALAGFANAATVNHMGKAWYFGVGVNENAAKDQELYGLKLDSTQIGWNIFLGKKVTKHILMEGGFTYLGDEEYKAKELYVLNQDAYKLQARNIYDVYLNGIFNLPVWRSGMHVISAFAKGGAVYMHLRNTFEKQGTTETYHSWTLNSFGANYGFGLQYKHKDYGARVTYNAYEFRKPSELAYLIPNTINFDIFYYFA